MTTPPLRPITGERLHELQSDKVPLMVFDCSYDPARPSWGLEQYRAIHIAGAVYADLDRDLSAPHGAPDARGRVIVAAQAGHPVARGRFPLPDKERFAVWLCSVGFRNDMTAVVYDRRGEHVSARLCWMLRWVGHEAVLPLVGGLEGLRAAGGLLRGTAPEADDHESEPTHFQSEFVVGPALPPSLDTPPPLTDG